jgi:hypothetical protein
MYQLDKTSLWYFLNSQGQTFKHIFFPYKTETSVKEKTTGKQMTADTILCLWIKGTQCCDLDHGDCRNLNLTELMMGIELRI